jgi:hypothetical protein
MGKIQDLLDQAGALDAIRQTQEGIWEELARICFPRSSSIFSQRTAPGIANAQADRGRMAENYDGTAMRACNTLATGQAARITPMGARWAVLRPPAALQGNPSAENYFARCTEILMAKLGSSNFYNRAYECYQARAAYGVSALEVAVGANGRGLHFRSLPIGTFAVAENTLDEVDTIFRTNFRTPAQVIEQFGKAAPACCRKKYDDAATRHKPSEKILHCVLPRQDRDPRSMTPDNKPIASTHLHVETQTLLLESGFDSVPVAVSRWQTTPLSPYGWGPADYALPEAAQANFMEQMQDVLAETAAFPRILYPAGMKDEIDFAAMGLTSFDPAAGETAIPREWLTAGRYDISKDRTEDKKRAIEAAFFTELFTAVSRLSPDATATQVSAILSESREMFHPIYSNMVREFHTPILRRCFTLLLMQGEMPPPPPVVIDMDELGAFIADPEVEYVSAMALALEQGHLTGLQDILTVIGPLAAVDPAWLRPFKPEAIAPHLVRAKGLPTSFLRSEEELAAMAEAEAAAAQQMQAAQATEAVRNLGGVDETAKAAEMIMP